MTRRAASVLAAWWCLTSGIAILLRASAPAPIHVTVYPSTDILPANHLKFYLHFTESMTTGDALAGLVLNDLTTGRSVPEPFRETELWDERARRLTLWLHPGRQKTGVNLNQDLGPVLIQGHRYELRLARPWLAMSGAVLPPAHLKTFTAGPAQREQLRLSDWTLPAQPTPGTRQPLLIRFPHPLDHALLQRALSIWPVGATTPLPGSIQVLEAERAWSFTPAQPWTRSPHELRVLALLEDLAGNSLARPFEVDLSAPPPPPVPDTLALPLTPP